MEPQLTKGDASVERERLYEDVVGEHCEESHDDVDQRHVEHDGRAGVLRLEVVHGDDETARQKKVNRLIKKGFLIK